MIEGSHRSIGLERIILGGSLGLSNKSIGGLLPPLNIIKRPSTNNNLNTSTNSKSEFDEGVVDEQGRKYFLHVKLADRN